MAVSTNIKVLININKRNDDGWTRSIVATYTPQQTKHSLLERVFGIQQYQLQRQK